MKRMIIALMVSVMLVVPVGAGEVMRFQECERQANEYVDSELGLVDRVMLFGMGIFFGAVAGKMYVDMTKDDDKDIPFIASIFGGLAVYNETAKKYEEIYQEKYNQCMNN